MVDQAVVGNGEAVTAVVVPQPGTAPTQQDVIEFCRERLGGFETPKAVGGKVLKYKLRDEHAGLYHDRQ